MWWLDFANHFLSNQRLHAWSWINRTFLGNGFFWWEIWLWVFLGLFLFCFCSVRGEKVVSAQDCGWYSKGEEHFKFCGFLSFLICLWQFCRFVQILFGPKTFLYTSFFFISIVDRESFFFLFSSFDLLIGNFLFFFFCFIPIFWSRTFFFSLWSTLAA